MGSCTSKEPSAPSSTPKPQAKRQNQKQALNRKDEKRNSVNADSTGSSNDSKLEKHQPSNPVDVAAAQNDSSNRRDVKVLLLGSGESGKSTIVKQMKILHQGGYSKEELYEYKPFVYKNSMDCIKNILNAIKDLQPELIKSNGYTPNLTASESATLHDSSTGAKSEESVEAFNSENAKAVIERVDLDEVLSYEYAMDSGEPIDPVIASRIKKIYAIPQVQTFIKTQQAHFYLIDSSHYFLSDIDRISRPDYLPTTNDVLRTRKKTSGIFDFKFDMGGGLFIHMYDVGGQRSERKKWIHCFDNVTLIIFCVALSEYDQVLLEENNQNRLEESLTLFDSVINSRWFARTSIVLFLNKIDVFAEKLAYSKLEDQFPDYTGGANINKAAKYILWRFTQLNRSGLNIFPHVTQATDTSNIQLVFVAVKETILENSLKDSGIL